MQRIPVSTSLDTSYLNCYDKIHVQRKDKPRYGEQMGHSRFIIELVPRFTYILSKTYNS